MEELINQIDGLFNTYLNEVFPAVGDRTRVAHKVVDYPDRIANTEMLKFLRWLRQHGEKQK